MAHLIAPSMLSADFGNLHKEIELINKSNADLFHLDIMDGTFVPNISYGFPIVEIIAKYAKKPIDAHLMIINPEKFVQRFAEIGVNYLSVHIEASTHLNRTLDSIKKAGMKAGVAINPHTPVSSLEQVIEYSDFILIMSVNPGFSGQSFIENSLDKISKLKKLIKEKNPSCLIEVDGGVNLSNAPLLINHGADILVAGSTIFGSKEPLQTIKDLKNL